MEGGYFQTLEEQLQFVKDQIKKTNLKKQLIEHPAWQVFKDTLLKAKEGVERSFRSDTSLDRKSGQYDAFCQMLDWADAIEKDLTILPDQRVELEVQLARELGGKQKGENHGRG